MTALKPALSIFSGTKDLGTVVFEQNQLNTKFTDFTIPFTGDEGNTAINWKGRVRSIIVQGFHDGTGFDGATNDLRILDFILELEQWISGITNFEVLGNVQGAIVFTNSFGGTFNVKCYDWTWARSVTDPFRINYSLLLKVV